MIYQPERVLLSRQISKLAPNDPGKTLDVGGGDGSRYRDYFKTFDFTSLDIDPETNPNVVASADKMPFMDCEFDTLLSSQVLEHVLSPQDCMNEMYRVLKPGGYLVLTVPQQNEIPASDLKMTIEEPAAGALFVRFEYDDHQESGNDAEAEFYNNFRRDAYKESDIDTVRKIRELAMEGQLDAPLQ